MQNKIIGIIGGMGPMAGVALHEAIIRNTLVEKEQEHLSVVLMTFPGEIADRTAYLQGENISNPAYAISKLIQQSGQFGVNLLVMACNTAYAPAIYDVIERELKGLDTDLELMHMPREICFELAQEASHYKKVGILSTNGTYDSDIYHQLLDSLGFQVIVPDRKFQEEVIHQMVYMPRFGLKAQSDPPSVQVNVLLEQALDFYESQGTDAIILGCTEFSLLVEDDFIRGMQIFNSTEIVAKKLVEKVLSTQTL